MEEMKKTDAKKRANRSVSITFFIASLILIVCSVMIIISCVQTNIERKNLMAIYDKLLAENEEFQIINEHLGDDNYYDIYVREEYQFEGSNVIRLPR